MPSWHVGINTLVEQIDMIIMIAKNKKIVILLLMSFVVNLSLLTNAFAASSISTSCVYVANGVPRSTVIVRGKGMRGKFYARIFSLTEQNWVISKTRKSAGKRGSVKFVFDSDPEAIAKGATEISANFNKNEEVAGTLRDADTNGRIGLATADCKIK
ncbi:hypothetical protein MCAMS1_00967 [biofilm metagenome]